MYDKNTREFVIGSGTVLLAAIFIAAIVIIAGTYRIETGEGAILTNVNGNKVAIKDTGFHWRIPLATDLKIKSIVNNRLYFPQDLIEIEKKFQADSQTGSIGYDITASDNKVIDVGGMVQFTIVDLVQYGVMNTNPDEQLQKTLDGEFFKILQSKSQSSEKIINDQGTAEEDILRGLKTSGIEQQYGVNFTRVQLIRPTYTKDALAALAKKQALISISEGELTASRNKANATLVMASAEKTKADMLEGRSPAVLRYMSDIELYKTLTDKPISTWVVPQGQSIVLDNNNQNVSR